MSDKPTPDIATLSFEQALAALEKIVDDLERDLLAGADLAR